MVCCDSRKFHAAKSDVIDNSRKFHAAKVSCFTVYCRPNLSISLFMKYFALYYYIWNQPKCMSSIDLWFMKNVYQIHVSVFTFTQFFVTSNLYFYTIFELSIYLVHVSVFTFTPLFCNISWQCVSSMCL